MYLHQICLEASHISFQLIAFSARVPNSVEYLESQGIHSNLEESGKFFSKLTAYLAADRQPVESCCYQGIYVAISLGTLYLKSIINPLISPATF